MKCPFKMKKDIHVNLFDDHSKGHVYVNESFAPCDGDECPCYYQDDNGVDKCSRCDPIIEEEL